ncbi:hypothetical protein ACFYUR_19115 [Micromonospora haikouensis]|uniref:hypothetical protein n=1 Tax=Micromonospora haikouensis TaxID=686309 RepID=UPI0036A1F332
MASRDDDNLLPYDWASKKPTEDTDDAIEAYLRRSNPDAYKSKHTFEIRDGKIQATEVKR